MKNCMQILVLVVFFALTSEALTVLNFDGQDTINYGIWQQVKDDPGFSVTAQLDSKDKIGKIGSSYKVTYKVTAMQKMGLVGVWVNLDDINLSKFTKIVFWIKAGREGCNSVIAVNFAGGSSPVEVGPTWKKIEIPLSELVKKNAGQELGFVVDNGWATLKEGVFYLDEISLE